MPTPEIFAELRQMAQRITEIADMYSTEESEEDESEDMSGSMEKPDKVSAAMQMFKKKDEY